MSVGDDRIGVLAAGLVAVAAGLAIGCGRDEDADVVRGKELFVQKCGACHQLRRANTRGVQGPDLDHAFGPARRDGLGEETVEGVVRDQIAIVRRTSKMPPNLVRGDDARDVAAYVAMVAGARGEDKGELAQAGKPEAPTRPAVAKNGRLDIDADPSGALAFTAGKATARKGRVELVMDNPASVQHNIAVRGGGLDEKGPVVGQGGTSRVSVSLKPGRYTFYCSVPGHDEGGMRGDLTVE